MSKRAKKKGAAVPEAVERKPVARYSCEMCGEPSDMLVGCRRCARLVCPKCVAAVPEDEETGEPICEECF